METSGVTTSPEKWLSLYGDILYQYTLPRVNDTTVAEDLVQETFLSALKALPAFKGQASVKNWLFAILKNKIIDHYRKKSTEQWLVAMPDLQAADDQWFNDEGAWSEGRKPKDWHPANTPVERKEIQKIINWCKNHLKELQQHVFTLKYMEDMDSVEICKVLNISSSNYWVLIHRARLQMRDCVEKNWLKN